MPGHLTPEAKAIADAINAGTGLKALADALYAHPELSGITRPAVIDIGSRLYLVCRPGYGPLSDPIEYLSVADEIA